MAKFLLAQEAVRKPSVQLALTDQPIQLDGALDEPAWDHAVRIANLTQQSPLPGADSPFQTEVRLLMRADHLYIGFICRDPDPKQLAIHTWKRDGDIDGDDYVGVMLDTFGDGRSGYAFYVNAAGARQDGLINGPFSYSTDWDGIWDARTRRNAEGWMVEIVIPARSLGFRYSDQPWLVELERWVPRERRRFRWSNTAIDGHFTDFSRSGQLGGMNAFRQGRGIEINPYTVARRARGFADGPGSLAADFGGEFTYRITPQLAAIFTANTDFAETEVDTRQVNLTRFPLFFPEKRAFFAEGAGQFDFCYALDGDFSPFFSRRIGLLDGQAMPILAGAKLLGRLGRWNIGFLSVRTGRLGVTPATTILVQAGFLTIGRSNCA